MFCAEIRKISEFLSENFQFLETKFSIYLNRCVFVMSVEKKKQRIWSYNVPVCTFSAKPNQNAQMHMLI